MSWIIKKFEELTVFELHEIYSLRTSVFVVEQDCPYQEVDIMDLKASHLYYEKNSEILAYLRILPAGSYFEELALGRVLVKKNARGHGLAKELLEKAIEAVANQAIRIEAQCYLKDFYKSFGFKEVSDEFLEDGIPHVQMLKNKKNI
ncbi:MAG: GNAT family N-acetyltransferase [Lactovum sp.]